MAYHFSLREVQLCGILSLEVVECSVGRTFNRRTILFLASDKRTGITGVYVAIVHSNITPSSKEFIGPEMIGFRCCISHGN